MKRLALLLLLIPSSGCVLLEDLLFPDDLGTPLHYRHQPVAETPRGTCGQNVNTVAAHQTAEPELLNTPR